MTKQKARIAAKKQRAALTTIQKNQMNEAIFAYAKQLDWSVIQNIHVFIGAKNKDEVDTNLLIDFLMANGKNVYVPKINDKDILNCLIDEQTRFTIDAQFGITEPIECKPVSADVLDVVFLPLLAVDGEGNRVGYGKGYYDALLKQLNPNAQKIGLSYFSPIDEPIEDITPNDQTLDALISPHGFYFFKQQPL